MFNTLITRYLSRDHALASIASALILISTFITEVVPQFTFIKPETAAVIVLVGSLCATVSGYVRATPALTWAGGLTLVYQIVTLFVASNMGQGTRLQVALISIAALLKFAAKFTVVGPNPTPLGTGERDTDIGRERDLARGEK